jgi:ubiquinone/menaquinone biosynthesis C-methylase UbiE
MSDRDSSPFEKPDVVASYESWYETPFGRLADELEYELLLEMLAPLTPGASLLEIGCGTAHFGARLARDGFRLTGIDPAAAMLAQARARIRVVRATAERLPFADASFDGALVVAVLDFAADPTRVLAEARRVARERVAVIGLCSTSWLALRRRRVGAPRAPDLLDG